MPSYALGCKMQRHSFDRPASLAEVAERVQLGAKFTPTFREFLDAYFACDTGQKPEMLKQPPVLLCPTQDAYLAAAAEYLSHELSVPPPRWTEDSTRFLHRPWFPCGLESLKALLIKESPAEFRRRMIFVELEPFQRPGKSFTKPRSR